MSVALLVIGGVLVGCVDGGTMLVPELGASPANPLVGVSFFVDPASDARRQADAWRSDRPGDAQAMEKIAQQPQADWFGDWNADVRADVARRVERVRGAGAVPVIVAYNIPIRDCGSHSAGGAAGADDYRGWVRALSDGLGRGPAVVILEPDAVAAADCLDSAAREQRFAMIRDAVGILKKRSGTVVYIDAGHPDWHGPAETAARLRKAGIEEADGFSLNVSNTIDTDSNVAYGEAVSARVGDAHFVIDTSRNGLGAPADGAWCNPSGRALGPAPTFDTGNGLVDAYLWIKRPGESDGECNGGPRAGAWWPDYALGLALRA